MVLQHHIVQLLLICSTLFSATVRGADTIEQFDRGASNVEIYSGYEGVGHPTEDRAAFGEAVVGFGLADFLSVYLGTILAGNGRLASGGAALYLGAFATPLDTDHVDLDLILDFSYDVSAQSGFSISPGFELNLDIKPDQEFMGFYIAGGSGVYGEAPVATPTGESQQFNRFHTHLDIPFLVGYYWTVRTGHQLFLTFDAWFEKVLEDDRSFEPGNAGFGYNVMLTENLELVTELFVDLPKGGNNLGAGAMAGIIGTM